MWLKPWCFQHGLKHLRWIDFMAMEGRSTSHRGGGGYLTASEGVWGREMVGIHFSNRRCGTSLLKFPPNAQGLSNKIIWDTSANAWFLGSFQTLICDALTGLLVLNWLYWPQQWDTFSLTVKSIILSLYKCCWAVLWRLFLCHHTKSDQVIFAHCFECRIRSKLIQKCLKALSENTAHPWNQ